MAPILYVCHTRTVCAFAWWQNDDDDDAGVQCDDNNNNNGNNSIPFIYENIHICKVRIHTCSICAPGTRAIRSRGCVQHIAGLAPTLCQPDQTEPIQLVPLHARAFANSLQRGSQTVHVKYFIACVERKCNCRVTRNLGDEASARRDAVAESRTCQKNTHIYADANRVVRVHAPVARPFRFIVVRKNNRIILLYIILIPVLRQTAWSMEHGKLLAKTHRASSTFEWCSPP